MLLSLHCYFWITTSFSTVKEEYEEKDSSVCIIVLSGNSLLPKKKKEQKDKPGEERLPAKVRIAWQSNSKTLQQAGTKGRLLWKDLRKLVVWEWYICKWDKENLVTACKSIRWNWQGCSSRQTQRKIVLLGKGYRQTHLRKNERQSAHIHPA